MKTLKEYITEGLLDRVKNKEVNHEVIVRDFLEANYKFDGPYTIKTTNKGFVVDVKGNVVVMNKSITSLTNGLFRFGEVSGCFYCTECKSLKTLEGAPKKCYTFNCTDCDSLTSLEGSPKNCSIFDCGNCENLTSLKGAPNIVNSFSVSNTGIKDFKDAPKKINSNVFCTRCKNLESLKGLKSVRGIIFAGLCSNLKDYAGFEDQCNH